MPPNLPERADRWIPAIVVAAAALTAFAPALLGGFVSWDDGVFVADNPWIRGLRLENIRWMLTTTRGGLWQPLTWLSYAVDHAVWGLEPAGFHLTNLLLHAASSVVFYAIALRLFGGRRAPAAWAALFFALHPLRVESVAWVAERKGLLSGLFFLLAALMHLQGRAWAAAAAFALALSAKATALTLPAVLLILEICPLRRLPVDPARWLEVRYRAFWHSFVPLILLGLMSLAIALLAGQAWASPPQRHSASWLVDRVLFGYLFYPWKTLWPFELSPYYPPLAWFGGGTWRSFALCAGAVATVVGLALLARRRPAVAAAASIYAVLLLPVAGFVQQGLLFSAGDRYSYLPCLGFAVLFGALSGRGRWAGAFAVLWLGVLGAASWRQCAIWKDSPTLWSTALARAPGPVARANVGAYLVKAGRVDEGRRALEQALAEDPGISLIYENLGVAARLQGREDEARAYWRRGLTAAPSPELAALLGASLSAESAEPAGIMLLRSAVAGDPNRADWRADLGAALALAGRGADAEAQYAAALALDPGLGRVNNNLGLLLEKRGHGDEAEARYAAALRDPSSRAEANHNLGNARLRAGKTREAERHFREALRVDPTLAHSRVNLGNVLAQRGEFGAAAAQYRAALVSAPLSVEARTNLGAIAPYLKK